MKALQKAAQSRESSGEKSKEQAAPPSAPELALQPLQTEPEAAWKIQPEAAASPALAAAVMRAGEAPTNIGAYLRGHPAALLSMVAALLLIGGGIYIYLAISKPGISITPARPPAAAPIAVAPARQVTPEPRPPLVAGLSEAPEPQVEPATPPPPTAAPEQRVKRPPQLPARVASQQKISITPAKTTPVVEPMLADAYQAMQQNRFDAAQESYQKMLVAEPRNAEAMLGLAAIAEQQKQPEKAASII